LEIVGWLIVIILFIIGMVGAVYPLLPGTLAIYFAFFVYGWFYGFDSFGFVFWSIQTTIVVFIFAADYAVSALGVKKFGGSRASVIGSILGLIAGPFVIPAFGLLIGPFVGAVIGELIHGTPIQKTFMVGVGSLVGLFSSMVMKIVFQLGMILIFVLWLWLF
jgi:uncharacterized protein YqgC (DUF456 family)